MEADSQVGGIGESCFRVLNSTVFSWINLNCIPEMQFWKVLTSSANKASKFEWVPQDVVEFTNHWEEVERNKGKHSFIKKCITLLLCNLCP